MSPWGKEKWRRKIFRVEWWKQLFQPCNVQTFLVGEGVVLIVLGRTSSFTTFIKDPPYEKSCLCPWCTPGFSAEHFRRESLSAHTTAAPLPYPTQDDNRSYQCRREFPWIYFCTANTPVVRQSDPYSVFEARILLVCRGTLNDDKGEMI